jgi:DNA-binding response OmpR family regulator
VLSARPSATILVVEDDPHLRAFYRSALLLAGYRVLTARDGADALHQIEIAPPAAVVLDIGLPHVSGHDVAQELRQREDLPRIPILVVTGGDVNEDDFDCVLRKPVTADALMTAVEKCLAAAKLKKRRLPGAALP